MTNQNQPIMFQRIIPLAILMGVVLLFTGCQSGQDGAAASDVYTELTFAFGADDSGTIQTLIDKFNKENEGKIKVNWKETSPFSDEFFKQIEADYIEESPSMDVIGADVVWTPVFAARGWAENISTQFFEKHEPEWFVKPALASATYNFKIWGVPWFTDAGILFYRVDLLSEAGYKIPPATWKELQEMASKIMTTKQTKYGYVFQGANYEGGTANACEYIWNAGGNILMGDLSVSGSFGELNIDPDIITVNSQEAQIGLAAAQNLVKSGIAPENIYEFKEQEAAQTFQNGEAVFMRTWPGIMAMFQQEGSKVKPDQIGLAPLPTTNKNKIGNSCLGGWNLIINARSSEAKKKAAWKFIRFMTSPESQRFRAMSNGILPTLTELYQDETLLQEAPGMAIALQVLPKAKERPKSPYYMDMSPEIAVVFSQLMRGEINAQEAVQELERGLENVLKKHYQ